MNTFLVPEDAGWHDDKALMAELSQLNARITRYILRYLDADAGQATPTGTADEHALGLRLVELGEVLQARAARRKAGAAGHGPVIDGGAFVPPALEPSQRPDLDAGP